MSAIHAGDLTYALILDLQRTRRDCDEAERLIEGVRAKASQPINIPLNFGGGGAGGGGFSGTSFSPSSISGSSNVVETAQRAVETVNRVVNETINKTVNETINKITNRIRGGGLSAIGGNIDILGSNGTVSFGNTQGSLNMEQSLRDNQREALERDRAHFLNRLNRTGDGGGFGDLNSAASDNLLRSLNRRGDGGGFSDLNGAASANLLRALNRRGDGGGMSDLREEIRSNRIDALNRRGNSGALNQELDPEEARSVARAMNREAVGGPQSQFDNAQAFASPARSPSKLATARRISNLHNIFIASVVARSVAGAFDLANTGLEASYGMGRNGAFASNPQAQMQSYMQMRQAVQGLPLGIGNLALSGQDLAYKLATGDSMASITNDLNISTQGESIRNNIRQQSVAMGVAMQAANNPTNVLENQIEQRRRTQSLRIASAQAPYQDKIANIIAQRDAEIARTEKSEQTSVYNSYSPLIDAAKAEATKAGGQVRQIDVADDARTRQLIDLSSRQLGYSINASVQGLRGNERGAGREELISRFDEMEVNASDANKLKVRDLRQKQVALYDQQTDLMTKDIAYDSKIIEIKGRTAEMAARGNQIQAEGIVLQEQKKQLDAKIADLTARTPDDPQLVTLRAQSGALGGQINANAAVQQLQTRQLSVGARSQAYSTLAAANRASGDYRGAATNDMLGQIMGQYGSAYTDIMNTADPTQRGIKSAMEQDVLRAQLFNIQSIHNRGYGLTGGVTEVLAAQQRGLIKGSAEPDTQKVIDTLIKILNFLQSKFPAGGGPPLFDGGM